MGDRGWNFEETIMLKFFAGVMSSKVNKSLHVMLHILVEMTEYIIFYFHPPMSIFQQGQIQRIYPYKSFDNNFFVDFITSLYKTKDPMPAIKAKINVMDQIGNVFLKI